MSNVQRYLLVALAAVVLVVGFIVLSDSGDDDSGGATNAATATQPAPAETDATGGATAPAPEPEAEADSEPDAEPAEPAKPRVPTIRVRGGEPVGGVETLRYDEGDEIDFRVRSDQADDVHVHGYDIEKPVPAGGAVRFRFDASITGRFEVELHHSGAVIARLEVQP
jgi:hypothetical protein